MRRLPILLLLTLALILFTATPTWARQALHAGYWDLASYVTGATARLEVSSDALPLTLGSIVILAALSASSGDRGRKRDRW
jgi:hypothetical protein